MNKIIILIIQLSLIIFLSKAIFSYESEPELNQTQNETVFCLNLEFLIESEIYSNVLYDKPFKIKNECYYHETRIIFENFEFEYCINDVCKNISVDKVNSWKTAGLGNVKINSTGNNSICIHAINLSEKICKNITVLNSLTKQCNVLFDTVLEKNVYENNEQLNFNHKVSNMTFPFIIEYYISELNGEVIREKFNTTNLNTKKFNPPASSNYNVYVLNSTFRVLCNNSNKNNQIISYFIVKAKQKNQTVPEEPNKNSTVELKSAVIDCENQNLLVDLLVYKGESKKTLLSIYLKDNNKYASDSARFYFYDKYASYNFKFYIPFTKKVYDIDNLTLFIDGLDNYISKNMNILCKKETLNSKEIQSTSVAVQKSADSSLVIKNISFACPLKQINVSFSAYKGDTRKTLVELSVKDGRFFAGNTLKWYITEKYLNVELNEVLNITKNIPQTGNLTLFISGLDISLNKTIEYDCLEKKDIANENKSYNSNNYTKINETHSGKIDENKENSSDIQSAQINKDLLISAQKQTEINAQKTINKTTEDADDKSSILSKNEFVKKGLGYFIIGMLAIQCIIFYFKKNQRKRK